MNSNSLVGLVGLSGLLGLPALISLFGELSEDLQSGGGGVRPEQRQALLSLQVQLLQLLLQQVQHTQKHSFQSSELKRHDIRTYEST